MAKRPVDYSFEKSLQELRQQGKEWGLTEEEIDKCICVFLEQECQKSGVCANLWKAVKFAAKVTFCLLVLLACFSVYLNYDVALEKKLSMFAAQKLMPYGYDMSRFFRKTTLPALQQFNFSAYYDENCLVDNPIFANEMDYCVDCSKVKTVIDASYKHRIVTEDLDIWTPFIVEDCLQIIVTYRYLQSFYEEHSEHLNLGTSYVSSNHPGIDSLDSLLSQKWVPDRLIESHPKFHSTWVVCRVAAVHLLRQLFIRPYFIPNHSEVALQKHIYIDGPKAEPYQFPLFTLLPNSWYAQGAGSRRLVLTPNVHCSNECSPVEVVVNETNVVFFNTHMYTVISHPVEMEYPEISVGYLGTFE